MSILLEHMVKRFGEQTAVNDVSLEVAEGELFVLLGPSGSGKSTVLRVVAGLLDADAGRVLLNGKDVTTAPPQHRGAGFVFQHYALFRHMSVAENVEFPLRLRRVPAPERRRRRDELLDLVGLVGLEGRLPHQLSGGQQQRVALARALARRPEVLLLDEPFGALDARIRTELRRALRRIQSDLKITTIFVTHDQEEAFELADRLGVMNFGRLLEVGPPRELYIRPQTEFVATFLGRANLMVGQCSEAGLRLGPILFPLRTDATREPGERRVQILFRPEDVAVTDSEESLGGPLLGKGIVEDCSFSGSTERLRLSLPALDGIRAISPPADFGSGHLTIEAVRSQDLARRHPMRCGSEVWVGVRRVHALTHPGLSFLLVSDGSPPVRDALALGGRIAQLAHARLTVLKSREDPAGAEERLQFVRELCGNGLASLELRSSPDAAADAVAREAARQHYDLVIHPFVPRGGLMVAQEILRAGEHHLLLVPGACRGPGGVLICVALGEPGKADVLFAGRLVRHLGAVATILTVLPDTCTPAMLGRSERFLAAASRTLSRVHVESRPAVRRGRASEQIAAEIREGKHDIVVIGESPPGKDGKPTLDGFASSLLGELSGTPLLIVRSSHGAAP